MKNKYLLWIGLFVWIVVGLIFALLGLQGLAETSSVVGVIIILIYALKRMDEKEDKHPITP